MKYRVTIDGRTRLVEIDRNDGRTVVSVDGVAAHVDLREIQPGRLSLRLAGRQFDLTLLRGPSGVSVYRGPQLYGLEVLDARRPELRGLSGRPNRPFELSSIMPGKVARLLVTEGQRVGPEDGIVVIEAMKMENELRTGHPGIVQAILVKPGQLVESGAPLVRFGPVVES